MEAREVVVLKSAEIKPYNEALAGFKSSCDCDVSEIVLSETENGDAIRKVRESNPSAVLAVGMDALNLTRAIGNVPVVYAMVPPSHSFAAAPKNLSGVNMHIPVEKYISAMLEVFQGAKRIGVIYDPKNSDLLIKEALKIAQTRGVELVAKPTSRAGEMPPLIDGMKDRIDVFWMLPDTTVINPESVKYLFLFSFRNKVPVFTFSKKYVEMGSAAALYVAPYDMGTQAGELLRKLAAEKNPVGIRIDVKKTVLVINRKIIRKLGLRIRDDVMKRAENVD